MLLLGSPYMWNAFEDLPNLLTRNDDAGPERRRLFSGGAADPIAAAGLSDGMTGFANREAAAVAEAYDCSGFRLIADVGGNNGHLLTTLLLAWPGTERLDLRPSACPARRAPAHRRSGSRRPL